MKFEFPIARLIANDSDVCLKNDTFTVYASSESEPQ